MGLENNLERIFKPLRNPKIVGSTFFMSVILASTLTKATYFMRERQINEMYFEAGGDIEGLSPYQKADYIRSQSDYKPNRVVDFWTSRKQDE